MPRKFQRWPRSATFIWQTFTVQGSLANAGANGSASSSSDIFHVYVPPPSESLGYDASGNRASNSHWAESWNALDQLTSKSVDGGSSGILTTTYTYLPHGELDTATLPGGGTSTHTYYLTGETKAVGGTAEYPVSYIYDAQGRMTSMTTATGTTTWTYDTNRGWLNSKSDGVNPAVTYTYQHSGKLATRRWSRGIVTSYQYGAAGDLTGVSYSDGTTPSTAITYDNRGRQATLTDAAGTHTFGYWTAGGASAHLPASEAVTGGVLNGVNISNSYDSLLRRSAFSAKLNSATVAGYTDAYDSASRLASVTDNMNWGLSAAYTYLPSSSLISTVALSRGGATRVTLNKTFDNHDRQLLSSAVPVSGSPVSYTYTYDASGRRSQATLADSSSWQYGYDSRGEVTSGAKQWGDGTSVFGAQFGYGFDAIGNRLSTTINGRGATYTPNTLNQYTSRSVPGYVDVTGEINAAVTALTVNTLTPTRQNSGAYYGQELSVNNASSPVYLTTTVSATSGTNTSTVTGHEYVPKTPENYTYDADGNLTSDGRWQYTWDGENRLITVETNAAAATAGAPKQRLTFAYDSQGRRISKKLENWNGTAYIEHHTLLFIYDGWNLAAEIYKPTGMAVRSYIWGADLSGGTAAGGIGGLLFVHQSPENKSYSYGYDGNGNVTCLHDMADASLAARYEYGPFGEPLRASGLMAKLNPVQFSTKYLDEWGGVYYGARYLKDGRWLSCDPVQSLGGLNLYSLASNNAINCTDAFGLSAYKLGTTDPTITPDAGAGAWNSEPWTLKMWLVEQFIIDRLPSIWLGMPDAAEMLDHYFDNSGSDYSIDLQRMIDDVPSAQRLMKREINDARQFAETLKFGEYQITSDNAAVGYNEDSESWNWFYAVGGYKAWGKGALTVCDKLYELKFEYKLSDRYNWDAGKFVTFAGLKVTDQFMGEFQRMGMATEFDVNGSVKKTVKWRKGKTPLVTDGWNPQPAGR